MKALKTSIIGMLLIVGQILLAQPPQGGQQGPPPVPNAKQITKMVETLTEEINLDETQKTAVSTLYTEHFAIVKKKVSSNNRPKHEDMEALNTKLQTNVKALLDDTQIEKYEAYIKKEKKQRKR